MRAASARFFRAWGTGPRCIRAFLPRVGDGCALHPRVSSARGGRMRARWSPRKRDATVQESRRRPAEPSPCASGSVRRELLDDLMNAGVCQNLYRVAVVGSGPAGLMAAQVVAEAGHSVCVFERRASPGRKLLIAGNSGLNITNDAPLPEFLATYHEGPGGRGCVARSVEAFPPQEWRRFIEMLGVRTFLGSGRRWFVEGMKASALLAAWLCRLEATGACSFARSECTGFRLGPAHGSFVSPRDIREVHSSDPVADHPVADSRADSVADSRADSVADSRADHPVAGSRADSQPQARKILLTFADGTEAACDAVLFGLGGASWEKGDPAPRARLFRDRGVRFHPFRPSNVGFRVAWPPAFLKEAEGLPLKNVVMTSARGTRAGDLVVTAYGVEGTPVYAVGEEGTVHLDLLPDLPFGTVLQKLLSARENMSCLRRVRRLLRLCAAAQALVFHCAPAEARQDVPAMARTLKAFPVSLLGPQPLDEAISSAGGVSWDEIDDTLMLTRIPGVFVAGEVIDWDAPTGGFLIQACVSLGYRAGHSIVDYLARSS